MKGKAAFIFGWLALIVALSLTFSLLFGNADMKVFIGKGSWFMLFAVLWFALKSKSKSS